MARVLLLEIVVVDRFHRGIALPFVRGLLNDRGFPNTWLRFGVPAHVGRLSDDPGFGLPADDLEALRTRMTPEPATHVLCSVEPSADLMGAIQQAMPGAVVGFVQEHPDVGRQEVRTDGAHPVPATRGGLAALLGGAWVPDPAPRPPDNLFDSVVPSFDWEAGNAAALEAPSLPFLVCGPECSFSRNVEDNPFFQGVDLSGCARRRGCAFCTGPSGAARFETPPVQLFHRQVDALARTHAPWAGRLSVRAVGEPIMLNVEAVASALRHSQLWPLDLLLDTRSDTLVSRREQIVRALEQLEGTGHRLHLALVGVESFAQADLDRYNKGIRWRTNLRAVELLFELEHAHPETFAFREHGGLSLILLSPWTSLRDLSLNLAILRRARLGSVAGKIFDARLRLYPSLPLFARARHDGLLRERYDDAQLDTARANFYADEVPWRFADPGLEAAGRLLVRIARGDDAGTEAQEALDGLRAAAGGEADALALAEAVVDAATLADESDVKQLASRAATLLRCPTSSPRNTAQLDLSPDWIAFELGLKPVLRLEPRDRVRLASELDRLRRLAPVAVDRPTGQGREKDLFLGHRREQVEEAVQLTTELEGLDAEGPWREMVRRLGALLGYPSCCVESFASAPSFHLDSYTWLHIRNRLDAPERVDPLCNPGPGMLFSYVPCSLCCEATARLARAVLEVTQREEGAVEAIERCHENPWVLVVDRQGVGAELLGEALGDQPARYRLGAVQGWDPLLDRLRQGDRMRVEEQHLDVLKGDRLHAALGARAFVWSHTEVWQRDLWTHLLRLRLGDARVDADPRKPADEGPPPGPQAERLAARMRQALPRSLALAGFRCVGVEPHREREALVTLASTERLCVMIGRLGQQAAGFASVGDLTVYLPRGQAADTHEKRAALEALARRLNDVQAAENADEPRSVMVASGGENRTRVLLVGSFRSVVPEGSDGPFGSQGGFVDTLAPAPYSLANGYLKAFVEAEADLRARYDIGLLDLAEPLELEDEREQVELGERDLARIVERRPAIVGFSAYCWNVDTVLETADVLHERLPDVKVVIGGRATDADAREILSRHPGVDAVVVGEGELALREVLRKASFEGVGGVFTRRDGEVVCGGPPRSVQDLDEIPSPWLAGLLSPARNAMMMELSRGCLHACGYCSWNSDKHLRFFSAERLGREIRWALDQGHEHVTLNDSALNYDSDRLEAFVQAVRSADPEGRIHFTYNVRHDLLDEQQLRSLSRLPTHMVLLGVETLSPKGMSEVDRAAVDVDALRDRLDALSRAVRPPVASIVLGLPEDDEAGFCRTLDTLMSWTETGADGIPTVGTVLVSLLQVYGGSKLWRRRDELGLRFQQRGIPYLLESPSWPAASLARCKARIARRIGQAPERLKAAEALVLMQQRGGVSPWLSRRVLGIVLRDWPEGTEHRGWTLERLGWMRDTGQGALLRFRWREGGGARVRLTLDEEAVQTARAGRYRVSVHPLGGNVPSAALAQLGRLVLAVVRRGEHHAVGFLAARRK